MKVIQGLWLSADASKNRQEIESVIAVARDNADVIQSIVVGNEVLLRGEMSAADLAATIREVKSRVSMPVTYADVWEFWLRYREVYEAVDFVTIHILPYWEDIPIPAEQAAAHVASIRRRMAEAFPGKEILIGESGWPSQGRMREGALPSLINQAYVIHDVLAAAKRDNFRVNIIEAFDQPWKRALEGTVGGHWGLLDDRTRDFKFDWNAPVSNHAHWRRSAAMGSLYAILIFAAAWCARREKHDAENASAAWFQVGCNAALGGALLGIAWEKTMLESLGAGGWLRNLTLLAIAVIAPLLGSAALMRGAMPASFARVLARKPERVSDPMTLGLGLLLVLATLMTLQIALGLVFDPRYRDFPYAQLTMAIAPFLFVLPRRWAAPDAIVLAQVVAAALLGLCAAYIAFNEGLANWQALWVCGSLAALALILSVVRDARGLGQEG